MEFDSVTERDVVKAWLDEKAEKSGRKRGSLLREALGLVIQPAVDAGG